MKDKDKKKEKKDKDKEKKNKKHKEEKGALNQIVKPLKIDFREEKLCKLIKSGAYKQDMEAYVALIKEGEYVCGKCGRVAKNKKNLCNSLNLDK